MRPETDEPSVERFARVTPPVGHEARVRARSGPAAATRTVAATAHGLAWRWVLPVTASVLVVIGAVWQSNRASRHVQLAPPAASDEWNGKGVDVPVLPPRAYWEMSAVDEFERLRGDLTPAAVVVTSNVEPVHQLGGTAGEAAHDTAGREPPWSPLPPMQLDDIAPAPLEVPAISGLEPLELEPIRIDPIDIVPVNKEQK